MTTCDYAACRRSGEVHADGWVFCWPHLRDHQLLMACDLQNLGGAVSGHLLPSCSLQPLLAVLRPARQAVA